VRQLPVQWTKHLKDSKSKEDFELLLRNSTTVLSRLLDIIKEEEETLQRGQYSYEDFKDPNWHYKQAFRNGESKRLKQTRELLSFITSRNKD
jgi:hypothetical protein